MTAGALLEQVRSGQVSATELVKSCLDKLHRVNELTDAVIAFNDERALSEAAELDAAFAAGAETGPLHGLPITVKDWIDAAGFPCAGATGEFDRWPTADATVVSRLREAGAVIVAKSRPSGSGPQVRHPLDSKLHPGGSSSGEAVLLAAGASPLGIGSDSGGSIRLPAAWCGVWGLKPTAGLVPVTGHFPACGSLSDGRTQIGPMAGSVLDLEIALRVIAGPDFRDAGAVPVELGTTDDAQLSGRRYAIITAEGSWSAAPDTTAAVEAISTQLAEAGLIRVEWSMPWLGPAMDISLRYWNRGDLTGEQVEQHLEDWDSFRNSYLQAAEQIDFIISPVATGTAPAVRQLNREDYVFTLPASLTGSPALALPGGADGDGRPIGVQIMGRPWEDHAVLALGHLLN